jgi:hypothetical protein
MNITKSNRSRSYKTLNRNIQIGECGDPISSEPKRREVDYNSADEESGLGKFKKAFLISSLPATIH